MVRKTIMALCAVVMMPLAAAAQQDGFEKHFSYGEGLYRMERYSEAYDEFRQAWRSVASCADDALRERVFYFGAVSAAKGERGVAEELLRRYIAEWPEGPGIAEVRFELGCILFAREDYAAAREQYAAIKSGALPSEYDDEYDFKYGYSCFKLDMFDEAVKAMARIDFKSDYYPHAQYVLGYAEYRRGDYAAAKRYFTVIADHPAYRDVVPFYIIQIEFNDQNYHYVRENCGAVLRMATGERLIELNRIAGESWFLTGGWRETVQYLKRYAELGGHMGREENYMIGFSDYMTGEYEEAEQYLSLASGPDDKLTQNASYHLADCYLRMGKKQQALQSFAMAATEGYDDTISEDALFNYGKLQYELGGGYFNEAINVLNRYLTFYPNSSRVPLVKEYLAAAYYNSRNYDAAYQALMQVPNPDNNMRAALQKITYFRALEYYKEGKWDDASRLLDQSLANRFNAKYTALASYWQGELLYKQGDMDGAAQKFTVYVRLSPRRERENRAARYNLGYTYFNKQDWDNAKKWFDDFLMDYPLKDSYAADAYNRRGDIEYSQRAFWRAIEFYDKAASMGTDERYYSAFQRAMMLGMVQRPERKIESLNDIVRKGEGPYVASAMYELGRAYMERQRYSEAKGVLERFVTTYPTSPRYTAALNELGLACQNLGDNNAALGYYKKVMENERNSDAARSAMTGIRTIYVETNDVNTYFKYAESIGVETDLGEVQRDSLAYVAAQRVYLSGETGRAAAALDNYLAGYPKGSYVPDALYFSGENAVAAGNKEKAVGYYRHLVKLANNDFTVRGLDRLSSLGMELKLYDEAADAYLRLSKLVTGTAKRDEALGGYLDAVVAQGYGDTVIAAADTVLSHTSDDQLERHAKYAKATALRHAGRNDEAVAIYSQLNGDVSSAEGAESAYRVIAAAYAAGDNARVEELVYAFADRNTPHSYWLGKAFIVLGDMYAGMGDAFQARATYQSVVDGYPNTTDGVVDEAKARIAAL